MALFIWLVLLFAVAFLLGSIPWGVLISRRFYHRDIRDAGSGNIGTTNAMRTLGKKAGAAVFVLDFVKGLAAACIALFASSLLIQAYPDAASVVAQVSGLAQGALDAQGGELAVQTASLADQALRQLCLSLAFAGCVAGHIFTPWLKFKGGKGIAVAVGALFVVFGPLGALIELAFFAVLLLLTRYVSAGSLAAAIACPFVALWVFWGNWLAIAICTLVALVVIWAHRSNIKRLLSGTENRMGSKGKE